MGSLRVVSGFVSLHVQQIGGNFRKERFQVGFFDEIGEAVLKF